MTSRAVLLKEIETLPTNCIGEVIDFVAWIKQHKLKQIPKSSADLLPRDSFPETMLLSEASLSKDWNTPEEDEAWASL